MSSHDPFEFFELDPKTATEADVKAAYAKRLKTTRPDQDRDGFMALRQAFENARNQIRWRDDYGDDDEEEYDDEDTLEDQVIIEAGALEINAAPAPESESSFSPPQMETEAERDPVEQAMEDIKALTQSPFAGASFKPWDAILDRDDLQPIDEFQQISHELRWFLCESTGYMSDDQELDIPDWLTVTVFHGLSKHFGWHRHQSRQQWFILQTQWLYKIDQGLASQEPLSEVDERQARRARRRGRSAPLNKDQRRPSLFDAHKPEHAPRRPQQSDQESSGNSPWIFIVLIILALNLVRNLTG